MDADLDVASYYERMTASYLKYGGKALGWHLGLWDGRTSSMEEAISRSNSVITEGCNFRPGQLVLDAGCGVGGLAFYLAQTFQVHVVGITICKSNVDTATQFAKERGLDQLVEFRYLDFMNLDFKDNSFDFVFNQESFCYALNKKDYLKGVHRVLRSGGRWQSVDVYQSENPLTEEQEEYHRRFQSGWKTAPLPKVKAVEAALLETGFKDICIKDLSEMVYPSAFVAIRNSVMDQNKPESEIEAPCSAFGFGLFEGAFSYQLVSGAKKQ